MKSLTAILSGCVLLTSSFLSAECSQNGCSQESNYEGLTEKGCKNPSCKCGDNCKCGPGCKCK